MDKQKKILSIILCVAVALVVGISQFTTGMAEVDETIETTVATEAKAEDIQTEAAASEATSAVKTKAKTTVKTEEKIEVEKEVKTEVETKVEIASGAVTEDTTELAADKTNTEEGTTEQTTKTKVNTQKQQESEQTEKETTADSKKSEEPVNKGTAASVQEAKVAQKKAEAKEKEENVAKANPAVEEAKEGDNTNWEYAPAWAGTEQKYIRGNLLAAVEARELSIGVKAYVEELKTSIKAEGDVHVNEDADNIGEALAVYAVLTEQTDGFPYSVTVDNEDNAKLLQSIYWNMNWITGASNKDGNVLSVKRLSIEEATETLGLTAEQADAANKLLTDDARADVEIILKGSILTKLSDEELKAIEARLPEELSAERKAVLMAGLSLEGKIGYFWGGKSFNTGWDERWGEMRTVVGSKQDGKVKPLGLDCSGFVSWAFINASGDQSALNYIGNGTANQYRSSKAVAWNEVIPGDLLFYKNPSAGGVNHVGIVVTVNENGTPKEVIHCASSKNGVVVTGPMGFKYARRPYIYGE